VGEECRQTRHFPGFPSLSPYFLHSLGSTKLLRRALKPKVRIRSGLYLPILTPSPHIYRREPWLARLRVGLQALGISIVHQWGYDTWSLKVGGADLCPAELGVRPSYFWYQLAPIFSRWLVSGSQGWLSVRRAILRQFTWSGWPMNPRACAWLVERVFPWVDDVFLLSRCFLLIFKDKQLAHKYSSTLCEIH